MHAYDVTIIKNSGSAPTPSQEGSAYGFRLIPSGQSSYPLNVDVLMPGGFTRRVRVLDQSWIAQPSEKLNFVNDGAGPSELWTVILADSIDEVRAPIAPPGGVAGPLTPSDGKVIFGLDQSDAGSGAAQAFGTIREGVLWQHLNFAGMFALAAKDTSQIARALKSDTTGVLDTRMGPATVLFDSDFTGLGDTGILDTTQYNEIIVSAWNGDAGGRNFSAFYDAPPLGTFGAQSKQIGGGFPVPGGGFAQAAWAPGATGADINIARVVPSSVQFTLAAGTGFHCRLRVEAR